jgi:MFS family permease
MVGYAVSAVLGASTLGSLLAAAMPKVPHYAVFLVCMVINAVVIAVLASMPGPALFFSAAALFGFFWLFFLPFQLPMAIEADPTRRITVVLPGAQLVGAGAGPLLSSFFVTDSDARGALLVCSVCFLIAFVISTLQHFRRRKLNRLRPQDIAS